MTDFSRLHLGPNQPTYDRLKLALNLNLRRQIFIAVCDDLPLRDRLAMRLQSELAHFSATSALAASSTEPRAIPKLVTLDLDLHDPNPLIQVTEWLSYFPRTGKHSAIPAFQILGIEGLTRQTALLQSVFLAYLQNIEQQLPLIESCLLLWMTQPWYRLLPEAVPEFWQCRTGVFEFIGDPTPLPVTAPERIQLPSAAETTTSGLLTDYDRSSGYTDSGYTASSPSANPWLPLAEDLTLYEPDLDGADAKDVTESARAEDLPFGYEHWVTAFSQVLEQELQSSNLANFEKLATTEQVDGPEAASQRAEPLAVQAEISLADSTDEQPHLPLEEALFDPLFQHIELLQQQIALLQQDQGSPAVVASAYRSLGNFYRDCIEQGDASAENIATAIQSYEQALQWLPEAEQAEILNDLGSLYWTMAQLHSGPEELSMYLQQAVQIYGLAVQHLDPEKQPQVYTLVQNNLAAVYADLANHQEPVTNLQQSIAAYQQVLQYRSTHADPSRYASTYNNLGTAYWNLAQHHQAELNLKQAIAAYTEALNYYSPEQEPMNYAMIHNNLGTAYWNLSQYGQPEHNLKRAITAYQAALKYRTLDVAPAHFAATQNNLGTAYWHLSSHASDEHERLAYLEQAIDAYSTTLEIVDLLPSHPAQRSYNFDLASTQNNLGLAHYQIASHQNSGLDTEKQSYHLETALQLHISALEGWEQQPELRQIALNCILQTVRGFYRQLGLPGQNHALSQLPGSLLSEILPRL